MREFESSLLKPKLAEILRRGSDAPCMSNPDLFSGDYTNHISPEEAKRLCEGCPVLDLCLDYAIEEKINHGILGGKTSAERRRIAASRRRRDKKAGNSNPKNKHNEG